LPAGCGARCELPITYLPKAGTAFTAYNAWARGDTKLSWTGAESGQGTHEGVAARGSPMAWTSSSTSSTNYDPENT